GTCFDVGFPTTLGAYDVTYNGIVTYGRTDVVITKYDSTGTFLRYSTYLGGADGTEIVTSLIVDSQNNLLLYGATGSSDFPVTAGAFDTTFNKGIKLRFIYNGTYFDNGTDIYVSKLDSTGSSLLASTYIGGTMNDGVNVNNDSVPLGSSGTYEFPADSLQYNYGDQYRGEINVDKSGNVYINSSTRSGNFPVTPSAFDQTLGGKQDAVVFKLSPDLKTLIWSTFLGGSDNDAGNAITLDDEENVYVTGGTRSNDFPTTPGSVQPAYKAGKADGYITKIKSDGTAILNSTYWGTDRYDQCYFIQLDQNKNVYVVGQTEGKMPVTAKVYNNPNSSQFITKMDSSLSSVLFSTVFGNGQLKPNISPSAFLVDYCENIYVSGWGGDILKQTPISNMPITSDAIQKTTTGFDFYLIVFSRNAEELLYGTYFGGPYSQEHVDGGTSRFDKKGVVYQSVCAGCGSNDDFPVYPSNAWPNTGSDVNHSDNCNNGTFKLNFKVPGPQTNFTYERKDSCAPIVVQFKNQSPSTKFLWDFGNNDTTSTIRDPVRPYSIPGTYPVKLYVFNALNCYTWDTVLKNINVYESINAKFEF
ncbi:MAG TPA: SBBP repeat-containing protein, partial [Bacteroidia bacterium]|nr:SBBP repeat-containing protein [Bacteroidia bacterium]